MIMMNNKIQKEFWDYQQKSFMK